MRTRKEIVRGYYDQYDEDGRLSRTRHGQLEYNTTMTYIHRYAAKGARVLNVGAGTGRYSIALAKEGMDVTAVELVESNLAVLRVTKPGGVLFFAFISVFAIMYANYFFGNWAAGQKENFKDDYKVRHFQEQLFTGHDVRR